MSGGKHRGHRRWWAWSVTLTAFVIMLSGGCGPSFSECAFDADCGVNEACAVGTCRQVCSMDEDCEALVEVNPGADIACRPLTRPEESEAVNVCAPPDFEENNANNDLDCISDQECVVQLGSELARCSLINTCIMPAPDYGILVRDLGTASQEQTPEGVEVMAIYVEDSAGTILGWAVSLDYNPAQTPSPDATQSFDGSSLAMDEALQCVATPLEARGVTLGGEGGSLRVYFIDDGGARLALSSGWKINIIERGANCGADEISDEYEVRLCVSRSGDTIMTESQCEEVLADLAVDKTSLTLDLSE